MDEQDGDVEAADRAPDGRTPKQGGKIAEQLQVQSIASEGDAKTSGRLRPKPSMRAPSLRT